jgi:hypothetical protein
LVLNSATYSGDVNTIEQIVSFGNGLPGISIPLKK